MAGSVVSGDSGVVQTLKPFPVVEADASRKRPDPSVRKSMEKPSSPPQSSQKSDVLTKDAVTGVAEALNAIANVLDRKLSFKVNDETGRIMIQVKDGEGNVIRSIPPDDIRNMRESMGSLIGLIYNDMS